MRISGRFLAAAVLLAGCSGGDDAAFETTNVATEAAEPAAPSAPAADARSPVPAPNGRMLAYRHEIGLELPGRQVPELLRRHEGRCQSAGADVCQVLSVRSEGLGGEFVSASLELRARPDWLARFRADLDGEARKSGGRVASASTTAEDLTAAVVDTEARLRAHQTLRDRLQGMLERRPGALADVLAVEKELARVQAELDASRSQLAVLRTRVVTSSLSLDYSAEPTVMADGVLAPVRSAATGFVGRLAAAFAAVITATAYALPWLLLLVGAVWTTRRLGVWRRLRPNRRPVRRRAVRRR